MGKIAAVGLAGGLAAAVAVGWMGVASAAPAASHVDWCQAHYRTYSAATDTYTGNDGQAHACVPPFSVNATVTLGFGSPGTSITTSSANSGHRYNVFPSEDDPAYGTPAEPNTPQSGS